MTVATIIETGEVIIINNLRNNMVAFYTNTPSFFFSPFKGRVLVDIGIISKNKLIMLPNHI